MRNRQFFKWFFLLMCAISFMTGLSETAGAWSAITHYHVNRSVGVEPLQTFGFNGTGPDMSIEWVGKGPAIPDENGDGQNWSDYFHSPNPKIERNSRPFATTPNFGYLMLRSAGRNGVLSDEERARALGWGGHIAGDWVAHSDKLFPICPSGSRGEKKHFIGECLYDLYSFVTDGPIGHPTSLSVTFDDRHIYKALFNYRLISIHENSLRRHDELSDSELKQKAIKTTLPRSYIRGRIHRWAAKLALVQFAYTKSPVTVNPARRVKFVAGMYRKGAESNLSLSEMSVYAWTNVLTPRGGIPDFAGQVVPHYAKPLRTVPAGLTLSGASFAAASFDPADVWLASQTSTESADAEDARMWDAALDVACADGFIELEETETPEGLYRVSVHVRDEVGLAAAINETVERFARGDAAMEPIGLFWKRLLLDGEADPELLADLTAPDITILSPPSGAYTSAAAPVISARIQDDPLGVGVDTESASLTVDGVALGIVCDEGLVSGSVPAALGEGVHRARLSVRDLAGNERCAEWIFTVDTVGPKLCYTVKNRIINNLKPRAEALVLPDEPVGYAMRVHPVIKGYPDYGTVVYEARVAEVSAAQRAFTWDATDGNGSRVVPGGYLMRIEALDRAGNSRVLNISIKVEA